jgi:peroxiredoxin Q/BCP
MRRFFRLWPGVLAACGLAAAVGMTAHAAPTAALADDLKVGDPAPDFTLPGSDGKPYSLSQLKGKTVVLAWFPMAFTGG